MPTKITNLTQSNVAALRETHSGAISQNDLVLTATTAEWTRANPTQALRALNEIMGRLPGTGHPRASLHAVCRKLAAAQQAPEPEEQPEVEESQEDVEDEHAGAPIEIKVQAKLQQDIDETTALLKRLDDALFDTKGQYDAAADKAEKSGKKEDIALANRLHEKVVSLADQGTAQSQKLRILKTDEEFERRVQSTSNTDERIKKMADTATKTPKVTAKDQGFPAAYLGSNGNFKPGLDARAKSDLINAVLGIDGKDALHKFSKADAEKLIKARSWEPQLERKREIVAAKAKKAEEAQAAKTEAAKAKAEAKKSDAKATTSNGSDSNEAKSDPKPTSTKKTGGRKVGK